MDCNVICNDGDELIAGLSGRRVLSVELGVYFRI